MKKQNLVLAVLSVLFLAAGIFFAYRVNQPIPSEGQAKKIQNNLTDVLADVNRQADNQLKRLSQGKTIASSETQFLLIDDVKILQWTDNHFIPSYYVVAGDYDVKYVRLTSGDFIVRQFSVDSTRSLVAVIPLHVQYRITNDYLKPYWHPKIFDNSKLNKI
ncbi:MAG TPA: hypothetical protein PKX08_16175 [Cyclobacteriaceae bacterium]|nr:hypothetical protein [Cyclobacteriaceae bacterium]